MQSKAVFLLSTACFLASAEVTSAQVVLNSTQIPSRFTVGADFAIFQPKGEFAGNVPTGYGFDVNGLFKLDQKGWFGILGDVGGVRYGHEHSNLGFFGPLGLELDLNTDNRIEFGSLGIQLQIPDGWFRPYANASYAGVHFTTESCVSNPDDLVQEVCNSNHGDWAGAGVFGGGLKIPVGRFAAVNLGARYHYGAKATYLRKGDIIDNPDGTVTLNVRSSKTDLVLWQIGFSYNIPQSIGR